MAAMNSVVVRIGKRIGVPPQFDLDCPHPILCDRLCQRHPPAPPGVAAEYADALGRPITYVDMPFDQRRDQELGKRSLFAHLFEHVLTMARLHAANRYDRLTHDVEAIIGRPVTTIRDFVAQHKALFDKHGVRQGSSALAASSPGSSRRPRI
jgi:hypothetical protein